MCSPIKMKSLLLAANRSAAAWTSGSSAMHGPLVYPQKLTSVTLPARSGAAAGPFAVEPGRGTDRRRRLADLQHRLDRTVPQGHLVGIGDHVGDRIVGDALVRGRLAFAIVDDLRPGGHGEREVEGTGAIRHIGIINDLDDEIIDLIDGKVPL